MDKFFAIVILATVSLWGCASGGELEAPTTSENSEPDGTMSALTKVDETSLDVTGPQGSGNETKPAEPYPAQTGQANMLAPTGQAITAIAPSGVIDLSDISPDQEAEGTEELIELPAPGVPVTRTLLIETAKNDLASRLDIDMDDVTLIAVESAEWPDSSLGCPAQDADYLTVPVNGFRITLEVNGQRFIYHTDMTGQVILCEDGRPADP